MAEIQLGSTYGRPRNEPTRLSGSIRSQNILKVARRETASRVPARPHPRGRTKEEKSAGWRSGSGSTSAQETAASLGCPRSSHKRHRPEAARGRTRPNQNESVKQASLPRHRALLPRPECTGANTQQNPTTTDAEVPT